MITRRSRTLIDFEVQTSLLRKVAFHWCVLMGANALALFGWTFLMNAPVESWADVTGEFFGTYAPVFMVSLALFPVFLVDTAKLSNRFVGPILRIRRALGSVVSGETVEPVKFRENDFWRNLADDFNSALAERGRASVDGSSAIEKN